MVVKKIKMKKMNKKIKEHLELGLYSYSSMNRQHKKKKFSVILKKASK
jgi:hypothetical protein